MYNNRLAYKPQEVAEMLGVPMDIMYKIMGLDGFPKILLGKKRCIIPINPLEEWFKKLPLNMLLLKEEIEEHKEEGEE